MRKASLHISIIKVNNMLIYIKTFFLISKFQSQHLQSLWEIRIGNSNTWLLLSLSKADKSSYSKVVLSNRNIKRTKYSFHISFTFRTLTVFVFIMNSLHYPMWVFKLIIKNFWTLCSTMEHIVAKEDSANNYWVPTKYSQGAWGWETNSYVYSKGQ